MRPMTGEEIAQEYGWTRQYVSNTLKSAMKKIFVSLKKKNPNLPVFDIVNAMRIYFEVSDDETSNFFSLFPPKIRQEIKESCLHHYL